MVFQELSSTLRIYFPGVNDEYHLSNLKEALKRQEENGLPLKEQMRLHDIIDCLLRLLNSSSGTAPDFVK